MTLAALTAFLLAHPAVLVTLGGAVGALVWAAWQRYSRPGVDRLEALGIVKAHPEVVPLIEDAYSLLSVGLHAGLDAAVGDLAQLRSFDGAELERVAQKMAADAWAQARKALTEKRPEQLKAAEAAVGAPLLDNHFMSQAVDTAKVLIRAQSGRLIVAGAPKPPEAIP